MSSRQVATKAAAIALPKAMRTMLSGQTALVTGGLGFIGSALSARLRDADADVHTASRSPAPSNASSRHWPVDLGDDSAVVQLVQAIKPRYVFHLASHVMGAPDLHHVMPAFRSNLQTTV